MLVIGDFFCGGGGAARGIADALDEAELDYLICGYDIQNQPKYPYMFFQHDAMPLLRDPEFLARFDFIWASPPCLEHTQAGAAYRAKTGRVYDDYLREVVHILRAQQTPYCIENVPAAPLERDLMLCGTMFNLPRLLRHRIFKMNFKCAQPVHEKHVGRVGREYVTVAGGGGGGRGGNKLSVWREAMGIDWLWMTELANAVPPAYSKYIVEQWLHGSK